MPTFLDPTNDVAFRRIFGNEKKKNTLISFLNSVLQLPADRLIVDITYLDRSQIPPTHGLRETILDVQCRDQRGITYIVVMQLAKRLGFETRVVYYSAKSYVNQSLVGDDYPALNQVIFLGILDFTIFESESYLSNHLILDTRTLKNHLQDLQFCFVELPKFNLNENELSSVVEKWVYFLKNAKQTDHIPSNIQESEILDAYHELEKYSWTEQQMDAYIRANILAQDKRGELEQKFLEGEQSGINKTALNMFANGFSFEQIAVATNLKIAEIEALINR